MLGKAPGLGADEVVIDLEDAVAPDAKRSARDLVQGALIEPVWAGTGVAVRVNGTDTAHCLPDLLALVPAPAALTSLVVPKVESAFDVCFIERIIDLIEADTGTPSTIGIQALIETPAGVRRLDEITAAGRRLETLIIGYADLGAALGRPTIDRRPDDRWLWVQESVLAAARAASLQAIDGPWLAIRDTEGFTASAERARELGFDGKWALHPTQVEPLNTLFAPSRTEFDQASALLAALAAAEADGRGAVLHEGAMIDEASRKHAARIVAAGRAAGLSAPGD